MSHFFYLTPEILLPFSPLTSQEFELIRRKAGESWQNETRWSASSPTTYIGSYRRKKLEEPTGGRFSSEAGQQWPGSSRAVSASTRLMQPNRERKRLRPITVSSPLFPLHLHAGLFPHLTSSWDKLLGVRHRVAHQVLWGDFPPTPPNHGKSHVRTKKLVSESPMKHGPRRTVILRRPPEPSNSASKAGSSEDSDADQYYVYSLGGPLQSLS
ncbi:uncharacterized protein C4orf51 homolog [Glossophaga mutica]